MESMLFNLLGHDGLSPVFDRAGDNALRMAAKVDAASALAGKSLSGLGGRLTDFAGTAALMTAKVGAALPAAASLASTLAQVAPAAGVAATGIIAAATAAGALKLGMVGVSDAVTAAMDPSDPKAYAAALQKLSPAARSFVGVIHQLGPQLAGIRRAVQDSVFKGLDKQLMATATSTLPTFYQALNKAGGVLNSMAQGVMATARSLGRSGALGEALDGATSGLQNLKAIPGQLLQGLVQVGAAAAPAFGQLTGAIGSVATSISKSLSSAFSSGKMQEAISTAVSLLKELMQVGVNVGSIMGDIFRPMVQAGGGLIGVLRDITGAISKVTASAGVQAGLKAIYDTMAVLGRTVAPLLAQALAGLGPVFAALGPPAQTLITALGNGLRPIIAALGPVLTSAATAVGNLVTSFSPLLVTLGELIAGVLPLATPMLDAIGRVFALWGPVVQQVADILSSSLTPILAELPALMDPVGQLMSQLGELVLPLLAESLADMAPTFQVFGQTIADLLPELVPLIQYFADAGALMTRELLPALTPLIAQFGQLSAVVAGRLAWGLEHLVLPVLHRLNQALSVAANLMNRMGIGGGSGGGMLGGIGQLDHGPDLQQKSAAAAGPGGLPPAYTGGSGGGGGGSKKLTPAQERQILFDSGKRIVQGLINGMTADAAKIKAAMGKLAADVKTAFNKKLISRGQRDDLLDMLEAGTKRMQAVAAAYKKNAQRIADAKKYAADVTSNARQFASLTSITAPEGQALNGRNLLSGLQKKLADLKQFAGHMRQLKKMGLSAGLLRQIYEESPEKAAEIARQMAGDSSLIKSFNSTQEQIDKVSTGLGRFAADSYYDRGKGAAKGFLTGLAAEKAALEKQAEQMAEAIGRAFRRGLSGKDITHTAKKVAPGKGIGPTKQLPAEININIHGAVDPHATARAVRTQLLALKRDLGGVSLGFS